MEIVQTGHRPDRLTLLILLHADHALALGLVILDPRQALLVYLPLRQTIHCYNINNVPVDY